jgi:hypothetical protein
MADPEEARQEAREGGRWQRGGLPANTSPPNQTVLALGLFLSYSNDSAGDPGPIGPGTYSLGTTNLDGGLQINAGAVFYQSDSSCKFVFGTTEFIDNTFGPITIGSISTTSVRRQFQRELHGTGRRHRRTLGQLRNRCLQLHPKRVLRARGLLQVRVTPSTPRGSRVRSWPGHAIFGGAIGIASGAIVGAIYGQHEVIEDQRAIAPAEGELGCCPTHRVSAQDNDLYFFRDRDEVRRCAAIYCSTSGTKSCRRCQLRWWSLDPRARRSGIGNLPARSRWRGAMCRRRSSGAPVFFRRDALHL